MKQVIKPSDILFAAGICEAAICIFLVLALSAPGAQAVVTQNGRVLYTLPLDTDATVCVSGSYQNEITVQNGEIRVSDTNCPNHTCEKQGAISRGSIVCAPNGMVITVTNAQEDVDAVTQ